MSEPLPLRLSCQVTIATAAPSEAIAQLIWLYPAAPGHTVCRPLNRPRGIDPLPIDVEIEAANVLPGDDRSADPIRNDGGILLRAPVAVQSATPLATHWTVPAALIRCAKISVRTRLRRSTQVTIAPPAPSVTMVGANWGPKAAHSATPFAPHCTARSIDPLCIDVVDVVSRVLPGHDRPTRPVRNDLGQSLFVRLVHAATPLALHWTVPNGLTRWT